MSDSEGCDINCMCVKCKGKKRVSRNRIQETSSSDSDSPVSKSTKRRKAPRVLSEGQESSETDSFVLVKRKKRTHAPRVMSDDEASSGSGPRPTRHRKSVQVVSESEEGSSSDEYESSGIDDIVEEKMHEVEEDCEREAMESSSDSWEDGEESGSASSGWESDWNSMDEEFDEDGNGDSSSTVQVSRPAKLPVAPSSGMVNGSSDSESSDGQSEKCPICLRNFTTQEVGTPESCDHSFCAICLQEWAKNMNTCPVDRQAFTLILVRSCLEGKIVRRIPVESREQREDDEEIQEDPTPCEICGRCDREDRLLLCDECDSGYHLDCLDPPLDTVPVEEWFCPECVVANSTQIAGEAPIGDGELFDLIDDAHDTMGTSPFRRRVNRLLPRTRQSERVRTTIIRQEIERQAATGGIQPSTSSGVESLDSASRLSMFFGSRRPTTVTKKVVRKRKKKYRRKVGRRTTTSTRTSTKSTTTTKSKVSVTRKSATSKRKVKKKTKKKRQTKRKTLKRRKLKRCRVARSTIPHSVKGRLAEQLGMRAPKIPGQMLPDVRARNMPSNINFQRSLAGIPTLHLFGQPDQIDYFSSGSDLGEDGVSGDTGVSAVASRPRLSAARSARSLVKRKLLSASAVRSHSVIGQQQASAGPCDLISSILDSQAVWHSKKAVVSINRDRSFTVKGDIEKKKPAASSSPNSPPVAPVPHTDDRVSNILNVTPVNVNDVTATATQAPMYPGRDGNGGSRPPPGGGYQNFGNPRYNSGSSGSYGGYQGTRTFVPFGNTSSFDSRDSRAGYSDFLHGGPPSPFQGGSPVRFRMPPRLPPRRPPFQPRGANNSQQPFNRQPEETKRDEGDWKSNDENSNEEDEVDIYSDIEVAGAGGDAAEDVEPRHQMFDSLPPPPLPPAMLIGLGEQDSDDDSNEDLVIDDKTPQATSPQNTGRLLDYEKYDPAEPSYDSDGECQHPETIPLPSAAPIAPAYSTSQFMANSSNSNNSYLHSPVYDDSNSRPDAVVSQVVKEVLKVHLEASSSANNERCTSSLDGDDEEDEECPNFSIYSAASMDIARNTDTEATVDPLPVDKERTSEKDFGNNSTEREEEKEFQTDSGTPEPEEIREHDCATPDLKDENSNISQRENSISQAEEETNLDGKSVESADNSDQKEITEGTEEIPVDHLLETEGTAIENADEVKVDEMEINDDNAVKEDEANINNQVVDLQVEGDKIQSDVEVEGDKAVEDGDLKEKDNESESKSPKDVEEQNVEKANVDAIFGSDNESLVGGATSPVSAASSSHTPAHPPTGLEGLDTEAISETEEAIHFDELSDTSFATVEEDGEIPSKRRKKKKNSKPSGDVTKSGDENEADSPVREPIDYEEGEIVEAPKKDKKKDKEVDKKKEDEMGATKVSDENIDTTKKVSKSAEEDKKKKKKKDKDKTTDKSRGSKERAVLGSKENRDKVSDKSNRDDPNIAWKKPSKTKERNYRDGKGKPDNNSMKNKEGSKKRASSKDKDKESSARKDKEKEREKEKERKKKDKRQDMERYDVRKIVTDKKRSKRRDEFGRDLLRERSYTRTRSLSLTRLRGRSRSISRNRTNRAKRSPLKTRRKTRSRSRVRSRNRSRSRSMNRPKVRARSRDRAKKSRSRGRSKRSADRSRNRKRSRTRSRTKSWNRSRVRSRTRTPLRARDRRDLRLNVQQDKMRYTRRSMSPSWTPSWSQSGSLTRSSYSRSRSVTPRKHFRSYSRSYSRSWTPQERIPAVTKKTGAISKAAKKLTVTVSNTKESQKKKEKKKKDTKRKETQPGDKKKKRKDKSPAPSKEVFTSGDNILVSVNFNKSNKGVSKDTGNIVLTKDLMKRKNAEDGNKNAAKKLRKGLGKEKPSPQGIKARLGEKKKKNIGPRQLRIAAAAKTKPMAIIDLDQSPFREQTPSPMDLIVLSDSEDEHMDKEGGEEDGRRARANSRSPKGSSKNGTNTATNVSESQSPIMNNIGSYLVTSTGPKTPPEPQVKFSIAPKQTLRSIMNPLQEEDEDLGDDIIMDNIDRRIEEELKRNMGELLHKGPNTPPEPRGPSTPCSSPTSPDAYDPFDPTKSRSPSPVRPGTGLARPGTGLARLSPTHTPTVDLTEERDSPMPSEREDPLKGQETQAKATVDEVTEKAKSPERATVDSTTKSPAVVSESPLPSTAELAQDSAEGSDKIKQPLVVSTIADSGSKSPERNSVPVISQVSKPSPAKQFTVKPAVASQGPAVNSTSSHNTVASSPIIAALTSANIATMLRATPPSASNRSIFAQPSPMSITQLIGHHHLQHQFPPVTQRLPPVVERPSLQKILPQKLIPKKPSPHKITPQKSARTLNGEQMLKAALDKSTDVVDMELESPYSPASSEANDLFEPPVDLTKSHPRSTPTKKHQAAMHKSPAKIGDKFDNIFGESPLRGKRPAGRPAPTKHVMKNNKTKAGGKFDKTGKSKKEIGIKMDEEKLQILAELPSSAVELQVKDKWLKKLNRQERVVEEVKLSLKPHYAKKHVTKEEYKDILRRSVPKICHNRSGEINPLKIASLVEAYVKRYRYNKKKSSGSAPSKPKAKTSMWS